MDIYGHSWIPMDLHGHAHQWTSMDIHGYPWRFIDLHGFPWTCTPMDIYGHLWTSMDIHGHPWTLMDTHGHGHQWISMDLHGPPWTPTEIGWIPWNSVKFHQGWLIIPWGVHKSWVTVLLDGHGDCRLAGGRVVQVHKCNLQTTSAHPSIPNLVTGVGLSTFPLPSGQLYHLGGAGRYPTGFGADPVFPRVFQEGNLTCWCRMWGHPAVMVWTVDRCWWVWCLVWILGGCLSDR